VVSGQQAEIWSCAVVVRHYTELIAWQKAMDLVVEVYRSTESFPKTEAFGLTNQLRRAAVSIPSNIAEGQGRSSGKEFVHFLHIARGSLQELETQVLLAHRLGFLPDPSRADLMARTTEIARILNGLIRALSDH
jgi:four helix bundle protein